MHWTDEPVVGLKVYFDAFILFKQRYWLTLSLAYACMGWIVIEKPLNDG